MEETQNPFERARSAASRSSRAVYFTKINFCNSIRMTAGGKGLRLSTDRLSTSSYSSLLHYVVASLLRPCGFKKILNNIAFTRIVTNDATNVAL
jgi:hypothetical protein